MPNHLGGGCDDEDEDDDDEPLSVGEDGILFKPETNRAMNEFSRVGLYSRPIMSVSRGLQHFEASLELLSCPTLSSRTVCTGRPCSACRKLQSKV